MLDVVPLDYGTGGRSTGSIGLRNDGGGGPPYTIVAAATAGHAPDDSLPDLLPSISDEALDRARRYLVRESNLIARLNHNPYYLYVVAVADAQNVQNFHTFLADPVKNLLQRPSVLGPTTPLGGSSATRASRLMMPRPESVGRSNLPSSGRRSGRRGSRRPALSGKLSSVLDSSSDAMVAAAAATADGSEDREADITQMMNEMLQLSIMDMLERRRLLANYEFMARPEAMGRIILSPRLITMTQRAISDIKAFCPQLVGLSAHDFIVSPNPAYRGYLAQMVAFNRAVTRSFNPTRSELSRNYSRIMYARKDLLRLLSTLTADQIRRGGQVSGSIGSSSPLSSGAYGSLIVNDFAGSSGVVSGDLDDLSSFISLPSARSMALTRAGLPLTASQY